MEPEGSLPRSQVPATCPYPEPARSIPHPHIPLPEEPSCYYPPIYAWVSQVFLSFRFPHQNPLYAFPLSHTLYMPRPSHSWFYHPNDIGYFRYYGLFLWFQLTLLSVGDGWGRRRGLTISGIPRCCTCQSCVLFCFLFLNGDQNCDTARGSPLN